MQDFVHQQYGLYRFGFHTALVHPAQEIIRASHGGLFQGFAMPGKAAVFEYGSGGWRFRSLGLLGGSWVVISGVISPLNMGYNYRYLT